MSKVDRLRKRMFYQYACRDYGSAARLGESLLRAHAGRTDMPVYGDDLYNVALACAAAGRVDRAVELYTESIRRAFNCGGADLVVAARLSNLGALFSKYGQHESACRIFMQALCIRRRMLPHKHVELGDALFNMGHALVQARRCREAIPALSRALHIYSRGESEGRSLTDCLHELAVAHEYLGEYEEALPYAEAAWRALALSDIDEHYRAGYYLAQLYEQANMTSDACELFLSVLEWLSQTVGCSHSSYINVGTKAAINLAKLEEYEQAKELLQSLQKLIAGMVGHSNLTYANCLSNLALIHRQLEEWNEAEALIDESTSIKNRIMGQDFAITPPI